MAISILSIGVAGVFPSASRAVDVIPVNPVQTLNHFFFAPYGAQLDGDVNFEVSGHNPVRTVVSNVDHFSENIYDLEKHDNILLDFDIWLATKAPDYSEAATNISSFHFNWFADTNEYLVQSVELEPAWKNRASSGSVGCLVSMSTTTGATGTLLVDQCLGTNISKNASISDFVKIFTLKGTTVRVGISPHDGSRDLMIRLNSLKYGPTSTPITIGNEFQDVEVQTPAPIPALGIAAVLGSIRKLRRLSRAFG